MENPRSHQDEMDFFLSRRYTFALNFVQYFLPLGLISYAYIRIGLVSQFRSV